MVDQIGRSSTQRRAPKHCGLSHATAAEEIVVSRQGRQPHEPASVFPSLSSVLLFSRPVLLSRIQTASMLDYHALWSRRQGKRCSCEIWKVELVSPIVSSSLSLSLPLVCPSDAKLLAGLYTDRVMTRRDCGRRACASSPVRWKSSLSPRNRVSPRRLHLAEY